jgi:apolipoprotein N-acyltransferase
LWFLSTGPNDTPALAWIAPVPLLIVLPDLRLITGAIVASVASALGALNWSVAYGFSVALVLMAAIPYALTASAWRFVAKRTGPVAAVVAYGVLLASAEFFFSRISPHGTLGNVAYSQGDVLAVLQLASVTGIWGISFVMSMVAAGIAMAWRHRTERGVRALSLGVGVAPAIVAVTFGLIRLATAPGSDVVTVGLAVSDAEAVRQPPGRDTHDALQSVSAYARRVSVLGDQGARFVVLPEKFVHITPDNRHQATAILTEAARHSKVTLVAGWLLQESAGLRNVAVVFAPSGDIVLVYDKQHLVPGIELEYLRGNSIGILDGTPLVGVAICKDLDFPALGRLYAHAGVGMLLVPAWDFGADRWVHSRMAIFRGVEGGYAMVRTATEGLLTVTDGYGRVVAERASDESAEVMLSATVPVGRGGTLYSRGGDWFGWLCIAVVSVIFGFALLRRAT